MESFGGNVQPKPLSENSEWRGAAKRACLDFPCII